MPDIHNEPQHMSALPEHQGSMEGHDPDQEFRRPKDPKHRHLHHRHHHSHKNLPWKKQATNCMKVILNNKAFVATIAILVVYKLLYPDIKMLFVSKRFDWFSYSMSAFCMMIFSVEMIMQSLAVPGYFL